MRYQMAPRILASVPVLIFSLALASYGIAWYYRRTRKEELLAFITLMCAISLTQVGVIFAELFTAVELQLFWTNFVNAIGVFLIGYSLLWFALAYSRSDLGLTRRTGSLVLVHLLLNGIVVVFEPEILYEVSGVTARGPITVAGITFEQWVFLDRTLRLPFQLLQLYIYTVGLLTGVIFGRYVLNNRPHLATGQSVALILGIGTPIVLNGFVFTGLISPAVHLSMTSLGVTSAGFAVAIFRYRLFNPAPVGRQQLVTMMNDPVVMLDNNARVVDSNPAARELVDAPSDWQYLSSADFFSPLSKQIDPTAERLPVDTEIAVERNENTQYLDLSISHIRAESSEILGVLIVLRDITDQHNRRRRLTDKNEQLDELINIVSHDLRNPLSVASGNVEIARQETNTHRLDTVADALARMEGLVEETLQRARHDEDVLQPEPVSLSSLATESWEMVTTDSNTTLDVKSNLVIEADPEQIRTVLENLFRNAVEHNTEPIAVCVGSLSGTETQRDDVGFFLEDNGKGIPPENREHILEHGFSTRTDGTGFGLSIVGDIIETHGWDIRVSESEEGGARFEVTGVKSAPRQPS